MENLLVNQYGTFLKRTIRGAKIRGIIFGYTSKTILNYLNEQEEVDLQLRENAYLNKIPIHSRKNMALELKLISLNVNAQLDLLKFFKN